MSDSIQFNDLFNTTDYTNFIPSNEQQLSLNKNIQLVKGSDMYKNFYDQLHINTSFVRFYQIAIFTECDKKAIRSYLFKGQTSKGACFFDYKMIEIKDYLLSQDNLDKFVKKLKNHKKIVTNNEEHKVIFKYYPVYDFKYTEPPSGNEISQCYSELLN